MSSLKFTTASGATGDVYVRDLSIYNFIAEVSDTAWARRCLKDPIIEFQCPRELYRALVVNRYATHDPGGDPRLLGVRIVDY